VYFVTIKIIELDCIVSHQIEFQSAPESLHAPHRLCPVLKPSPLLLPVQFTQSSLRTTATPIVCSVYTVKLSVFFLPFIPCTSTSRVPESYQSYPMSPPMTPVAHSAIPYSPDMHFPTCHPFQRITTVTIHLPLLPPVHCHNHLFTIIADWFRLCRHSPPLILHHQKRN
jgi:hypothetical protein